MRGPTGRVWRGQISLASPPRRVPRRARPALVAQERQAVCTPRRTNADTTRCEIAHGGCPGHATSTPTPRAAAASEEEVLPAAPPRRADPPPRASSRHPRPTRRGPPVSPRAPGEDDFFVRPAGLSGARDAARAGPFGAAGFDTLRGLGRPQRPCRDVSARREQGPSVPPPPPPPPLRVRMARHFFSSYSFTVGRDGFSSYSIPYCTTKYCKRLPVYLCVGTSFFTLRVAEGQVLCVRALPLFPL